MPKILILTNEEKAMRYDKRFRRHDYTIQEKADLWDAFRIRNAKDCKKYSTEHPDRISLTASTFYQNNKVELNKNSCIRLRKTRELKKTTTTEL